MTDVKIYRTTYCPYCDMAKRFFKNKGVEFTEVDVTHDTDLRHKLVEMSGGRRTVPQIFINGTSVGGYTDVVDLDKSGKLQELLDS